MFIQKQIPLSSTEFTSKINSSWIGVLLFCAAVSVKLLNYFKKMFTRFLNENCKTKMVG